MKSIKMVDVVEAELDFSDHASPFRSELRIVQSADGKTLSSYEKLTSGSAIFEIRFENNAFDLGINGKHVLQHKG